METRANYVLIGLFTLAVIAGGFGFVYWFQHVGGTGERVAYRVQFQGAVSGLRTGSPVVFNGIRVGEVSQLQLNPQDPRQVDAILSVDRDVTVRADTEAGLEFAGLTGNASVALRGRSASAPVLKAEKGAPPPTIMADPTATQDVTESARQVMRKVERLIDDNDSSFKNALRNIETFTDALARNSDKIERVMAGVERLTGGPDSKGELAEAATALRVAVERLGGGANGPGELGEAARAIKQAAENLGGGDDKPGEIGEAARAIRQAAENLDRRVAEMSAGINRLTGSGLREWESLATEGRRTLAQIERTVKNFDRNPSRVIFGGNGSSVPEFNGRR
jgi:phospholipid/cholesterol/gamma-HCH transport system substrate-binding protein